MGCGRTDAQVHASQFYFHLDLSEKPDQHFIHKLNMMLPEAITIHEMFQVEENKHAQHSALTRTYDYFFHTQRNPFISQLSTYYDLEKIDIVLMKQALQMIQHNTDFSSCCLTPLRHTSTICNIMHAQLYQHQRTGQYRFQFKADHFLRGMIRILVGKLLLVGAGKLSVEAFQSLLKSKQQPRFLNQAYPQGLYLSKVDYAFLDRPSIADPFQASSQNEQWQLL